MRWAATSRFVFDIDIRVILLCSAKTLDWISRVLVSVISNPILKLDKSVSILPRAPFTCWKQIEGTPAEQEASNAQGKPSCQHSTLAVCRRLQSANKISHPAKIWGPSRQEAKYHSGRRGKE